MPSFLVTLLIVVPLTALTAWWNIQIRFASDKQEAMKMWKKNVGIMCNIIVFGMQIWIFVDQALQPLNRHSVILMIVEAWLIGSLITTWLMTMVVQSAERHWNITQGTTDIIKTLVDVVDVLQQRVNSLEAKSFSAPGPTKQIENKNKAS